jgi:lipid A ethanolaminephosphotransferase
MKSSPRSVSTDLRSSGAPAGLLARLTRPQATVDQVIVIASVFWALAANRGFLMAALRERSLAEMSSWGFALALLAMVVAGHALIVSLVAHRHTIKPVVGLLTLAAAAGSYFIGAFGVVLDPSMLRNVLRTDVGEAKELISPAFLLHMAVFGALPLLLLWRVQIVRRPWRRAVPIRLATLSVSLVVLLVAAWSIFQPLSSLMRNQKELRYLVTPASILWSVSSVVAADARGAARPRQAIGLDAAAGPSWATRTRPMVVVLVVGETARAANWGLSGYARQTTPELAALGVLNFAHVDSCGTNTETSLPCMFAPVGRRDYDEARIRGQESLLHVAARAGVAVHWRDNQSGCKGVCDGLPSDTVASQAPPGLCEGDRCLDEGLVRDLDARLRGARGTQLWVLHMLGNHGPSYFRRHPRTFARFQPECLDDDLRRCSTEQVVNSYDNALLYTDHVLATAIRALRSRAGEVDSALLYVSDHGESLGEKGLFLHGIPYAIAPAEQTRVPMVWWASAGLEKAAGLRGGCLSPTLGRRAAEPAAHDHLFHTLLGVLDVRTALYEPAWDMTSGCRSAAP